MTTKSRPDTEITADVLTALAQNRAVSVANLGVMTAGGYVTLMGSTDTYSSREAAEATARRVDGVRAVTNAIMVDRIGLARRPDADIEADVRTMLDLDVMVPSDRILVAVRDGIVTLTGTLDHSSQGQMAVEDAGSVLGVKDVVNLITMMGQKS